MKKVLVVCTTDSMIWNFLVPHIKFLESKGVIVECACSKTGFYFEELKSQGLILHEMPFERSPFKMKNISGFFKLRKLIKKNGYDLIQCHEPVGGAMGRLAGKSCSKKVMYFAHGFHFFKGAPIKHWLEYFTFEYFLAFLTDIIITICKEDYDNTKKLPIMRRYLIPGIGIDFSKYENISSNLGIDLRRELGIPLNALTLISVGELIPRKNHIIILKALKYLNNNTVHFIHCGEGELYNDLKKFCDENELANNVHFLGFRRDIPSILKAADVFIFPSKWEGLGLAGIEAMYSGLPVIGSNKQGIKDYVIENETGFTMDPDDYIKLSAIIKKIQQDRSILKKISTKAQLTASNYALPLSIQSINSIYLKENLL